MVAFGKRVMSLAAMTVPSAQSPVELAEQNAAVAARVDPLGVAEPRRPIRRIPDNRELHPIVRTDNSVKNLAGMNPDPDLERRDSRAEQDVHTQPLGADGRSDAREGERDDDDPRRRRRAAAAAGRRDEL